MEEKKDWVEEIGNIELEISYTSGVYDLAFLMGYGWYEEVEKIVEQIKQESREEVVQNIYKEFCVWETERDLTKEQKEIFDDLLSKLTTK